MKLSINYLFMMKYKTLIKKMTLEEKASLLSGKDFWFTRPVERLSIPKMAMADGPHGLRKQRDEGDHLGLVEGVKATCFPTSATIANSWNLALCEAIGEGLGKEAAGNKVNILLGPALNIKRNPLCGRNFEYFSEDPYLSGKLAAAYIRGIQRQGVSACPKHFAANNQEYLRMTNDSIVDERTFNEIYLTGFEIAVKEGKPLSIMSSYNKINGTYANENKELLREILVDRWGFEGIVISDWGGSNNHVEGVKAGAHLEMPTTGKDTTYQLLQAVKTGVIDEVVIDKRVNEYLNVLYKTELKEETKIDYEGNHNLARRAAEESIVLLKNENILPLAAHTKVAIIGDFANKARYQGAGSSMVNPYKLENTLEVIHDTEINMIGYAKGYERIGKANASMIDEAVLLAKKADVALVYIGLDEVTEVEGHDRTHMKISPNQVDLIKAVSEVTKVVAVISCGSAIEMPWVNYCDGVVHGYLSGQSGASAMLKVLTGKVNPSGKLSESYPYRYEDCPNVKYYPGIEKTSEYREGLYVGYRYYDTADIRVVYPFGYGLSYTMFEYKDLIVKKDRMTCKITNTGDVTGSEVVQLYVSKDSKYVYRPKKELKGFLKVLIKPLETVEVTIEFDEYTFRFFDLRQKDFAVEKGDYKLLIGASSQDIRLTGTIEVEGIEVNAKPDLLLNKYFKGDVSDISLEEFGALYGKEVPPSKWNRKKELELNDSLSQMVYAKSRLARLVIRLLFWVKKRSFKKGKPDLNVFFLSSMPFRAIAKMSGGMFSMEMVSDVLTIVNGHFFKGLVGLVKSHRRYRKRGNY